MSRKILVPFELPADPTNALEAATKQYADLKALKTITVTGTGALTGGGDLSANRTLDVATAGVSLAKMANLAQDQFIGRVTASTGVPETATITAVARTVLDDTTTAAMLTTLGALPKGGGTMTGTLTVPSIISTGASSFVGRSDTGPTIEFWNAAGSTLFGTIAAVTNSMTFGLGGSNTITISPTQVSSTVPLVLPADPTANLQAATKQYADLRVPKAGGTMTGDLVIDDTTAKVTSTAGNLRLNAPTGQVVRVQINNSTRLTVADTVTTTGTDLSVGGVVSAVSVNASLDVTATRDLGGRDLLLNRDAVVTGHVYCSTVPTNTNDMANKLYVDQAIKSLSWKDTVRAASTANIAAALSGTMTIDGVALVVGDRVLIKDQTSKSANGIYTVSATNWPRSVDADDEDELLTACCFISEGTVNKDTAWVCTTNPPITPFITNLDFVQFGAGGGGSITDVMYVGASAPTDPTVEIWYDTDEPTPGQVRQTVLTSAATTYTLALSDENDLIVFTAATAIALTVPTNATVAFVVGSRIDMAQTGAGKITVSGAGGVTVTATPSAILRATGSVASLVKTGTDTWILTGDLT